MGCVPSFEPGDEIIVENGRFFARGVVIGPADTLVPPYPEPRLKVEIFRNKIDVELRLMRLAMSADRPWADAPREMLEQQLAVMATQVAGMQAEIAGLTEVIAMQMGFIDAPPTPKVQSDNEWYERLVDRLENYLVRTIGERRPLRIDDVDLRALVWHIKE